MGKQKQSSCSGSATEPILFLLLVAGFLVVIAIPNFVRPSRSGPGWKASCCINNLRQIGAAANQFAVEHNKTNGETINFPTDLTPYLKLARDNKIPSCPSGGVYQISKIGEVPTCSLSNKVNPPHILP